MSQCNVCGIGDNISSTLVEQGTAHLSVAGSDFYPFDRIVDNFDTCLQGDLNTS